MPQAVAPAVDWIDHAGGLMETGYEDDDFSYDCEGPRHKAYLTWQPDRVRFLQTENRWDALVILSTAGRLWRAGLLMCLPEINRRP